MAYGNWGAFVYRNGERQRNREDNTPYKEDQMEAGYLQAFMRKEGGCDPYHASLGDGPIRLCGYKHCPVLFWEGQEVDLEPFKVPREHRPRYDYDDDWEGEYNGYKFKAHQYNGNMIDLELVQPDGTVWTSTCGYCYGAGHMD